MATVVAIAEGLPRVAIVGRPNVGKSTLFNRLVGQRRAIVDDAPGVTRDPVSARTTHAGRTFLCIDTGGISPSGPLAKTSIADAVRAQALAAIAQADCIVCVLDGEAGLVPDDRGLVRLLTRSERPVIYVVNKLDTAARDDYVADFFAAGVPSLLPVSAAHNRGLDTLRDAIVATLPPTPEVAAMPRAPRLALIGRPNVGKSSLLNRLLGAERNIVAPQAGTTRDTLDEPIAANGTPYILIYTAGIRRQTRGHEPLERHGAVRALGTLERADIVLVVLDAADGVTDQDARLIERAASAGRGIILLANKWDTVPAGRRQRADFERVLASKRPTLGDLPLLAVSAHTGEGLDRLFPLVARVERAYSAVIPTAALNRQLRTAVDTHSPPTDRRGRAVRLFYATQIGQRPPAITIFSSAPGALPASYLRYLSKALSADFGLIGVPLRLQLRSRTASKTPSAGQARRTRAPERRSSRPIGAGGRSRRR